MKRFRFLQALLALLLITASTAQQTNIPQTLHYQGRVLQDGAPYNGTGHFVFAMFSNDSVIWNNWQGREAGVTLDPDTEPDALKMINPSATPLPVEVRNGLFSAILGKGGDDNQPIDSGVFFDAGSNPQRARPGMKLGVWFSQSADGPFARLDPDIQFATVPYAMVAGVAEEVMDGAITAGKLAEGAVSIENLAPGAAAAGLAASGQSVVPAGGIVLSRELTPTGLLELGYTRVGSTGVPDNWDSRVPKAGEPMIGAARSTAVWTGSEMIVWGGKRESQAPQATGGRLRPATDTWVATPALAAPTGRYKHTAVWTGTEMIVWGGLDSLATPLGTGARYNPTSNTWTPVNPAGAPAARSAHTATWTGTEMLIWGGRDAASALGSGAKYNPATDTWVALPTVGAPSARSAHTAVWTGNQMVVWGGFDGTNHLNTGAVFDSTAGTWTPTSGTNAPAARSAHTAIWTGTEMLVHGGQDAAWVVSQVSARYAVGSATWDILTGSFGAARRDHTAVWTGTKMLIWGGYGSSGPLDSGVSYDSLLQSWSATPVSRPGTSAHVAVWTGDAMLLMGGSTTADSDQGTTWSMSSSIYRLNLGATYYLYRAP